MNIFYLIIISLKQLRNHSFFKEEIISVGTPKHDRDEKSQERKEKDKKSIRLRKISSLKRQISQREKQLEVTFFDQKNVIDKIYIFFSLYKYWKRIYDGK